MGQKWQSASKFVRSLGLLNMREDTEKELAGFIPGQPNEIEALDYCIGGEEKHFDPKPAKNRMVREFMDFERIVRENDRTEMEREMEDTLAVMATMEEARESSGIVYGK